MKNKTATKKAWRRSICVAGQIFNMIPPHKIGELAQIYRIHSRMFDERSHVFALLLCQIAHFAGLNETCDVMSVFDSELRRERNCVAPKRNTFSHANRTRDPALAETLYWDIFRMLQERDPSFGVGKPKGKLRRFRFRHIYALDSSTIHLVHNCIDWAKHRRRKAAVKIHMLTDVPCMLPRCVVIDKAKHHDIAQATNLCRNLGPGDIVVEDRAYNDWRHQRELDDAGVFFVVREKKRALFKVVEQRSRKRLARNVIADETIELTGHETQRKYPRRVRRVTAIVEVDGKLRQMVFLTNNFEWSGAIIAELYRARWTVEILFKELKQTLQLKDFLGENENAVKWQIWTALLAHLLLRYLKHLSKWKGSYSRLVGLVRGAVWLHYDVVELLRFYGTASPPKPDESPPKAPYLPGFEKILNASMGQHTA